MKEWMHERFFFVVPAVMLFGALFNGWPYGYFQILRWVTCASAAFYMSWLYEKKHPIAAYVFGGIVILFNPLLPIHLPRGIWKIADCLTAVFFIGFGVYNLALSKENAAHRQTKTDLLLQKSEKLEQEYTMLKKGHDRFLEQTEEEIAALREQFKKTGRYRKE